MTNSIVVAGGVAVVLALLGALLTEVGPWYHGLRKPRLNPPDWLFGPAWTLILAAAAASAVVAWTAADEPGERSLIVTLFAINAILFTLWSPLFFKLRRPDWALIEVVPFWASIVALVGGLWPIAPTAALLLLPYLAWVSFASWLNWAIVRLNRPFGVGTGGVTVH